MDKCLSLSILYFVLAQNTCFGEVSKLHSDLPQLLSNTRLTEVEEELIGKQGVAAVCKYQFLKAMGAGVFLSDKTFDRVRYEQSSLNCP